MSEIVSSNSAWSEAFHFIPNDEHMVTFLRNRLMGLPVPGIQGLKIKDVNVFDDLTPPEIFAKSEFREGNFQQGPSEPDKERYCFTELKRTKKDGKRFVRTTGGGTWKLQGSEKILPGPDDLATALKRAFTYKPRKSGSDGFSWVMYEYSLFASPVEGSNDYQDIAICKVRKRSSKKRDRLLEDDEEDMLRCGSRKFQSTREYSECVPDGPPSNAIMPDDGGLSIPGSCTAWLDDFDAQFPFDDQEMFTVDDLFKDDCGLSDDLLMDSWIRM